MKKCSKCLLPETHETIEYNENSVCNICTGHEFKREKDLIVDTIKKFSNKTLVYFSTCAFYDRYFGLRHYRMRDIMRLAEAAYRFG